MSAVATPSAGSLPDVSPHADPARDAVRGAVESAIGSEPKTPKGLSDALKRFQNGSKPSDNAGNADPRPAPRAAPAAAPANADRGPDGKFAPRKEAAPEGRKPADIVKPGVTAHAPEPKGKTAAPQAAPEPSAAEPEAAAEPVRPWFADAPDQISEMAAAFWGNSARPAGPNQPASPAAPAPAPVAPAQAPAQSQTLANQAARFTVAPEQFRAKLLEQYAEDDPIVQHLTAMDSFVREIEEMRVQSVRAQQEQLQHQRQAAFAQGYTALTGYIASQAPKSAALASVFGDGRTPPTPQQKAAQMDLLRSSFQFLEFLRGNGVTEFTDAEVFDNALRNSRFKHLFPASQAGSQQAGADPRRAGMDVASTSAGNEPSGSPMDGALRRAGQYINARRGR